MALLTKTRAAQYPLVQEFVFNFNDTMVDNVGATKDFKTVGTPVFKVLSLPVGAVALGGHLIVETAYAGPTAATVSVGDSGSATRFLAATDLKAAASTALAIPVTGLGSGSDVLLTFNLTVADATAGRARVRIMYTIDGRGNEVQST